jgi:hypothetical protein
MANSTTLKHSANRNLLAFLTLLTATMLWSAETETIVLRIDGALITEDPSLAENLGPRELIDSYYGMLSDVVRERAFKLEEELATLMLDYDFAFSAADTAEVNNLVSDIALCWAKIRTLHASEYTREVVQQIESAYSDLHPRLAAERTTE